MRSDPPRRYSRALMLLSIGDLVLDIAIVPDGTLHPNDDTPAVIKVGGGGQAANFCAWAASLGESVRLITRLGDDERGHSLVADLEALNVEVCPVWSREPTGAVAVLIGPNGERTMATQRGASVGLRPADLRDEWFASVRLLHLPAYSLFVEPLAAASRAAVERVRRSNGLLSIDLSSAAGIVGYGASKMARDLAVLGPDLLFATASEYEVLGVPIESVAGLAAVKLGPAGCTVLGHRIDAPPAQVVDATGAGDAFAAAFCAAFIKGASAIEAAERAVHVAARAVATVGARPPR